VHFIEPRYEQVHSLEEKNKCEWIVASCSNEK